MSPVVQDPNSAKNQARYTAELETMLDNNKKYANNVKAGALIALVGTGICLGSCLFLNLVRPDLIDQGLTILRNLP